MSLQPLYDRVLIDRIDAPTHTPSGLTIPASAQDKSSEGTVVAVGPGRLLQDGSLRPLAVQVGDKVMFSKFGGMEVGGMSEEKQLLLREDEILAIIQRSSLS